MTTGPIDKLVCDLAAVSTRWLPPDAAPATTLADAVDQGAPCWPRTWDHSLPVHDDLLLFPLPYAGRLSVTTATFHHLVDAGCEAIRGGASVVLVPVPTGRAGTRPGARGTVYAIADAAMAAGFPVQAVDELASHPLFGPAMLARACATPYTRRAVDLPDVVVAAAADAIGTSWVYLPEGVVPGRHLRRMHCCPPLSRLHDPADPFAAAPAAAKRPPAGTDAVWACAFTLGLTDTATPPDDWAAMRDAVRCRVAPLWKDLLRRQVVSRRAASSPGRVAHLRVEGHRRGDPVVVPLLGSPTVADGTRSLVRAASIGGPVTIVVDDLTPRFSYADYPADAARVTYRRLAADHHGTAEFLTDAPDLSERLGKTLRTLTVADAATAAGTRHHRRRGQLTGYDAVHLAVMAICATLRPATVAVKSANLPAIQALARLLPTRRVLAFSGPEQPSPAQWRGLPLPAEWLDPPS
jgi:hypothetical protein